MTRDGQDERISSANHRRGYHGSEHLVLVDLCTCGDLRYVRPKSLEAFGVPVGTVWIVGGTVHTHRDSGAPCFREPD